MLHMRCSQTLSTADLSRVINNHMFEANHSLKEQLTSRRNGHFNLHHTTSSDSDSSTENEDDDDDDDDDQNDGAAISNAHYVNHLTKNLQRLPGFMEQGKRRDHGMANIVLDVVHKDTKAALLFAHQSRRTAAAALTSPKKRDPTFVHGEMPPDSPSGLRQLYQRRKWSPPHHHHDEDTDPNSNAATPKKKLTAQEERKNAYEHRKRNDHHHHHHHHDSSTNIIHLDNYNAYRHHGKNILDWSNPEHFRTWSDVPLFHPVLMPSRGSTNEQDPNNIMTPYKASIDSETRRRRLAR
jgi:hypothetical protein